MAKVQASSSNFVTVALKLPNGFVLQNYKMIDTTEPLQGGSSHVVKRAFPDGAPHLLQGTARHQGESPKVPLVMGYAMNKRVPTELWERWLAANKDSAMVKNNLIFANPDYDMTRDEAREKKALRSGLEPLMQDKDPRSPRRKGLKIEKAKGVGGNSGNDDGEEIEE